MPIFIKCLMVAAILLYCFSRVIVHAYKDTIKMAYFLNKFSTCKPGIIAGLMLVSSWVCVIVVIIWGIFALIP